jgi:hypothetical protein
MLKKIITVVLVLSLLAVTCTASFASSRNIAQAEGQISCDLLSLVASEDFQGIEAIGFTVNDLVYGEDAIYFSINMTPDIVDSFTVCHLSETETQIIVDEVDSEWNTCSDTILFVDGVLSTIDGIAVESMITNSSSQTFSSAGVQALPVWQYYDNPPGSTTSGSYNVLYATYSNSSIAFGQAFYNMTFAAILAVAATAFTGIGLAAGVAIGLAAISYFATQLKNNADPYASTASYTAAVYRISGDLEIREKHSVTYNYPLPNGSTMGATIPFYRWAIG